MAVSLHIITEFMQMDPTLVWELLQQNHPDLLTGARPCYCGESKCVLDTVSKCIRRRRKPHFGVSFEQNTLSELAYGHIRNYEQSLITIDQMVSDVVDGWRWTEPFTHCSGFRQAWVFDDEFCHWQNADDPLEYTSVDRSYAGLPMKSNGLPYPLEQMIIDTSGNPGRREVRDGYVEAVGAVMWLGQQFWQVTGTRKEDVLAQDWLTCRELPFDVLCVQASEQPFTTAEGQEGRKQDQLRALLFPDVVG